MNAVDASDVKQLSWRLTHDVERIEDTVQSTIERTHAIRTGMTSSAAGLWASSKARNR